MIPNGIAVTPADVGVWVRHVRKNHDLTLSEAAALCGVGIRFLMELEHGKSTASLGKVLQVLFRMGIVVNLRERRESKRG
jgi:transcriptional regulator with XRE-family HTH domain